MGLAGRAVPDGKMFRLVKRVLFLFRSSRRLVMKSLVGMLLVLFVVLAFPMVSEARCGGRGGLFRGHKPVRTFLHNHRPHVFHRIECG